MTNSAADTFHAHAGDYDAQRRRLVPVYDDFYGTAVRALRLTGEAPARVLDLGAGTGLLAALVAEAYPAAELTLLDGAQGMLDQARARFGEHGAQYVRADLADALPQGPWDAIVSGLAIHHLSDEDKRALFARIHAALRPGGVFVNAEQVVAPTSALTTSYARWHERAARELGATDAEWEGAVERMRHDRCATVEDQLLWLTAAGFPEADCLYKHHRFAVIIARR